jgi:hypothetical protein
VHRQHRSAKLATIAGAPYEAIYGHIKFGNKTIALPASRMARMGIGIALILGGILGFLPILGFWMVPLGLIVLSIDIPAVRRWRRQFLPCGSAPGSGALPVACGQAWVWQPRQQRPDQAVSGPNGVASRSAASGARSFSAWAASTASSARSPGMGLERHALVAGHDVDVGVEHHLPAGRLVELLDGNAVGCKRLHGGARHLLHLQVHRRRKVGGRYPGCCATAPWGSPAHGRRRAA